MIDDQNDGVEEALHVMQEYRLLREDLDSLVELTTWPGKKSLMEKVDGRVKAALTRAYNKNTAAYTYSAISTTKKKRVAAADDDYLNELGEGGAEQISDDDEDDDDVGNDALIKSKKPSTSAKAGGSSKAGGKSKAGTSTKKTTSSKKK